jgi:hypothetical protein
MAIIHALLALSSVAVVLTAGNVQAHSIPPERPVSFTFSATQIPPVKPMPIGGGKEFVVVNQAMSVSNDAGNRCSKTWVVGASSRACSHSGRKAVRGG